LLPWPFAYWSGRGSLFVVWPLLLGGSHIFTHPGVSGFPGLPGGFISLTWGNRKRLGWVRANPLRTPLSPRCSFCVCKKRATAVKRVTQVLELLLSKSEAKFKPHYCQNKRRAQCWVHTVLGTWSLGVFKGRSSRWQKFGSHGWYFKKT
jgi:hypothetical protein